MRRSIQSTRDTAATRRTNHRRQGHYRAQELRICQAQEEEAHDAYPIGFPLPSAPESKVQYRAHAQGDTACGDGLTVRIELASAVSCGDVDLGEVAYACNLAFVSVVKHTQRSCETYLNIVVGLDEVCAAECAVWDETGTVTVLRRVELGTPVDRKECSAYADTVRDTNSLVDSNGASLKSNENISRMLQVRLTEGGAKRQKSSTELTVES